MTKRVQKVVYGLFLVLAAPLTLWTAFEMYGLTMIFGEQMLFFSVSHAYPVIAGILLLSFPFFVILALLNAFLLANQRLRIFFDIPIIKPTVVLAYQILQTALLLTYPVWASSLLRVPVCMVGLALLVITFVRGLRPKVFVHPPR